MSARWIEFIVNGPRGEPFAFLQGWLAARGQAGALLDAEAEGFDCEPAREKLKEFIHPSSETAHLLVREPAAATVREALSENRALALIAERSIASARFSFRFTTWSEDEFRRLRALFEPLPPDLSLSGDAVFTAHREAGAGGRRESGGAYAPVHDFEGSGSGRVTGGIETLLPLWRACRDEELIHAAAPELVPGGSFRTPA